MNSMFCKLKNPQKRWISFFASLKNLKKHEFHIFARLKNLKKHEFHFLQGPGGVFIDSEGVAGDDEDHDGSNEDGEHGEDPVDFD